MTKSRSFVLLVVGVAVLALFAWWSRTMAPPGPPPSNAEAANAPRGAIAVAATEPQNQREVVPAAVAKASSAGEQVPAAGPTSWALAGVALDLGGAAIPHVVVVLRDFGAKVMRKAVTDEHGAFALTLPEVCGGEVDVDDPAWTAVLRPVLWGNRDVGELTIVAAPTAPVDGVVVDQSGNGVAGAEVSISGAVPPRSQFARSLERNRDVEWRARSDADGRFEVSRAPQLPGMRVSAARTGYRPTYADLTARVALRLVLTRGEVLTGRVVDAQGRPVQATVFCCPAGANCDADGRFEIDISNASSPWLVAACSGQLPARLHCLTEPPNVATSWPPAIELRMGGPPLTIRGRAFDGIGEPIAQPSVRVCDCECLVEGNEMSSIEFLARTHARVTADGAEFWEDNFIPDPLPGTFVMRGLQERDYRIELQDPDTLQWITTPPIRAGRQDVEIRLPAEPRWPGIAGVVVDRRGRPVAEADVWIERADPDGAATRSTPHLKTDANGAFARGAIAQAAHTMSVQAPGTALAKRYDLRALGDVGKLRIVAPVKATVRVETTLAADAAHFLDAAGDKVMMTITQGNIAWGAENVSLTGGASEAVTVPDDAVTLVLTKGGVEVARVAVDLHPGELQVLRL